MNIDECREHKVLKIHQTLDDLKRPVIKDNQTVAIKDSRNASQDAKIKTKGSFTSVENKDKVKRCRSFTSTNQSTPEMAKPVDDSLVLMQEIHKNLLRQAPLEEVPLATHKATKDYRTKMVDWMVEVCTSFKCSQRTYFLAVKLFDNYLRKQQGRRVLENSDIHGIGVAAMYLASKFEDIYPLHSRVVAEKISHNAFSKAAILQREEEYLRLFEFQFNFVTPFDIHQTYMGIMRKRYCGDSAPVNDVAKFAKIDELSLLLVRMAIQNADFCAVDEPMLVFTAIFTAATLLQLDFARSSQADVGRSGRAFTYAEFKTHLWRVALEIEQGVPNSPVFFHNRQEIAELAHRMVEFFKIFDKWHCGLNQLKTFKKLSFHLHVSSSEKIR